MSDFNIPTYKHKDVAGAQNLEHLDDKTKVKSGGVKSRIQLIEGDPRFNIFAREIGSGISLKKIAGYFTDVKISTRDMNGKKHDFLININSAAKRLGITPEEVKEIAKSPDAIKKFEDKAKIRKVVLDKYHEIVKEYPAVNFDYKILLKQLSEGMTMNEEGKVVFLDKNEIWTPTRAAILLSVDDLKDTHLAAKDIDKVANKKFKSPVVLNLESVKGKDAFNKLTTQEKQLVCGRLIHEIAAGHQNGEVRGNINPKNFRMRLDENNKPTEIHLMENKKTLLNSARYSPEDYGKSFDYDSSDTVYDSSSEYDSPQELEAKKKADVYALSKTLIEILWGDEGRDALSDEGHILTTSVKRTKEGNLLFDKLVNKGYSDELLLLLIQGMGPEEKRPSAQELLEVYNKIIKN